MSNFLDEITVDWSDFEDAGRITRLMLKKLADDRLLLRDLVRGVAFDECLLSKCESHQLLDYLVIYDAPDRGFRVRVHLATDDHLDRPHDHRFSFSSLLLNGGYRHTWYRARQPAWNEASDESALPFMSRLTPDRRWAKEIDQLQPQVIRQEVEGSCYSLHHTAIHTTHTSPDCISLFIRGPAEKRRSFIIDPSARTLWWRFGHLEEPDLRRDEKRFTFDQYRWAGERLETLGIL